MTRQARALSGGVNYRAGLMAEDCAMQAYQNAGCILIAARWRGNKGRSRQGQGEIDLILRDGPTLVFVEVKAAVTHAAAGERIGARQIGRIRAAALEYLSDQPDGLETEMRFDAALVDGLGRVQIIHNAFGQD